ncbi:uncharacterized protein B0T23DRAFT_376476 [Neurospora hispaniola]|uniref:Uncharacterized protein n=1 Tax=Neurospora hispaniola TaxID=588809 RepID=A0AAJ0I9I7_9PEZI|nr:hypothetical protein B0T23DRAFT_376476 [Neurospora hispaniola]
MLHVDSMNSGSTSAAGGRSHAQWLLCMNTNQGVSHAVGLNLDVSNVRVPEPAFSIVPCPKVWDSSPDRSSNPAKFRAGSGLPRTRNLTCFADVIRHPTPPHFASSKSRPLLYSKPAVFFRVTLSLPPTHILQTERDRRVAWRLLMTWFGALVKFWTAAYLYVLFDSSNSDEKYYSSDRDDMGAHRCSGLTIGTYK